MGKRRRKKNKRQIRTYKGSSSDILEITVRDSEYRKVYEKKIPITDTKKFMQTLHDLKKYSGCDYSIRLQDSKTLFDD